jgi:hypothetical protein
MNSNKVRFPEWLQTRYRKNGKYLKNRFGDLSKNLKGVISDNPFDENFDSYNTLEDWLDHLDMHVAPGSVKATMLEAWESYVFEGCSAEIDFIKGERDEDAKD